MSLIVQLLVGALAFSVFMGVGGWLAALYHHQLTISQQQAILELYDRFPAMYMQVERCLTQSEALSRHNMHLRTQLLRAAAEQIDTVPMEAVTQADTVRMETVRVEVAP